MDIRETLRALPQSYDDVQEAIFEQLQRKPDSTPSDVLKVLCENMRVLENKQFVGDLRAAF